MKKDNTTDGCAALDHLLADAMSEISRQFPKWDWRTDERLLIFAKLRNLISCGKLTVLFEETCLENDAWWKLVASSVSEFDRQPNRRLEFDNFARFAMFQGLFSLYEAALRSFVSVLTSAASLVSIHQVNKKLLEAVTLPQPRKDALSKLTEFAGKIRNCIHNNMTHTGNDVTLRFRDTEFQFHQGKPPGFLNWNLFIHLAYDLAQMFRDLALTPEISGLAKVKSLVDFNLYSPSVTKPAEPS